MAKRELVLIDGHALAYRMYYALPLESFSTRAGEPTNAVYGFTRALMDLLLAHEPPQYLAVSFDLGKTFRDDLYPQYKATRAKMPQELRSQIGRIREVVDAFGVPVLEMEGYEADDVLGTAARQATELGVPVRILTGDRDLLQLVDANTRVLLATGKGTQEFDADAVQAKMGVRPDQVVDYKALVGDASDNIPGVRGIGDKTAVGLLRKFETLEGIYSHLDQVTGTRFHSALATGQQDALLSRQLAKIELDVPVRLDLEACRTINRDRERLLDLLRELEFRSLGERIRQIEKAELQQMGLFQQPEEVAMVSADPPASAMTQSYIVDTPSALAALAKRLGASPVIAFDTETTATDEMTADLVGIALTAAAGEGHYLPVGHQLAGDVGRQLPMSTVLEALRPVFASASVAKVAHNGKYDLTMLQRYGLQVNPIAFDTMLAAWLLEPSGRGVGLKTQAWSRLSVEMTEITDLIGTGKKQITMAQVPIAKAAPYAAADVDMTLRLVERLEAELKAMGLWDLFSRVEMPLIPVLSDMEQAGVLLDPDFLRQMSVQLRQRLIELEYAIHREAGRIFNINSTQQLSQVLFEQLGLPTEGLRKTASGYYSTAADVLDGLAGSHPIVDLILEHRELSKLQSTYVEALPTMVNPATGRIHTSYNQAGAITGRIASSNPNLQNIPIRTELGRQVRRAFVAQPGWMLMAADYSQVELRVLAHMSQDAALLDAFRRGQDIHATTAATVYRIPLDKVDKDQRRFAKSVNFGLLYGMSAFRLARESDLTLAEAEDFVQGYFESFPRVRDYLVNTIRQAKERGWVETALGRRRFFPLLQGTDPSRSAALARQRAEREAVNFPIQGTAADIIKMAMIDLYRVLTERGLRTRMILQVHDELVLEVPESELEQAREIVVNVMANAYQLLAPLQVDTKVGPNWLEMEPV
jgi:DNA polymerase-1